MTTPPKDKEGVVVLHGIVRTHRSMNKVARHLKKNGFEVLNLGYPSRLHKVETLAQNLQQKITRFNSKGFSKLHFVGYSMGGLIIRCLLKHYRPQNLGRVVFLATPHHGSEAADFWKDNFFYRWLFGPAGCELGTTDDMLPAKLGPVDFEAGVIAGDKSYDPFHSYLIKGKNDGKVSLKSARVEGMKDYVIVHECHTLFMNHPDTLKNTVDFLRTGRFESGELS